MIDLTFAEIQEKIDSISRHLPKLKLAILRNFVLESIEPYLKYLAILSGWNLELFWGNYDQILQDSLDDNSSILNDDLDFIFVFQKLETLNPRLINDFTSLNDAEVEEESSLILARQKEVFRNISKRTNASIICNYFELPIYPAWGIRDSQIDNGQTESIRKLNDGLRENSREFTNVDFIDFNLICMRLGAYSYYDLRYWQIAKAPYSRDALKEIACESFKIIKARKGKNKKCLILDCDNTLWGGIVGEDGLSGIKLGQNYPGSAFCDFQKEILQLFNRGVILALCSKNNEEDVSKVFREHPHMILKEKHFAITQINWNSKASNIEKIVETLNIGIDSVVFADDSEFEINLVRELLPDVELLHLPVKQPSRYKDLLNKGAFFDTLVYSLEDKLRGKMYKAEVERKNVKSEFSDITDYLGSLETEVTIKLADKFSTPRVAQLTQKTNQFNLTTKRYSEADIQKFITSPIVDVFYVQLKDKFGDYGIIGSTIVKHDDVQAEIDTFLLSCRALGREVENVFLHSVILYLKEKCIKKIIGRYLPTRKNRQTEKFYSKFGFEYISKNENTSEEIYTFNLDSSRDISFDYFKKINYVTSNLCDV
jgi:FkbH-like protein